MQRVLLAGHDDQALGRLQGILGKDQYRVTSTGSEEEAVRKIGDADIAIVDIKSRNGVQLVARMRAAEPHVPILVLTSETQTVHKALVNGATEWVGKPVDPAELKLRVSHALEKRGSRKKSDAPLSVPLAHLHDPATGRVSAVKVAEHIGIPLRQLAAALGVNYTAVHRTPAAESLQPRLLPLKRILEILSTMFVDVATVRAWLNSQHPDLGMRTPMSVILEGQMGAVETMLENALAGIPA